MSDIVQPQKVSLTVFVDESGSITKTDIEHHKYFIIAMVFTDDSPKIKTSFRRAIGALINKYPSYSKILKVHGEIKGSDVSEKKKLLIYEKMIKKLIDSSEIGIIVLENAYSTENFLKNHARTFNYLIQMYISNWFKKNSRYKDCKIDSVNFIIDEQNIASNAKYTLDGYLNQHFTVFEPLCNNIVVKYADSKNHSLLQLVDFISNSFFRNIEKHDENSKQTIKLLKQCLCGGRVFDFSINHNIQLFLDEE